jgi:hypothetical protein
METPKHDSEEQCIGTCEHEDDADQEIEFDDGCTMGICKDCYKNQHFTCPEHPESFRKIEDLSQPQ